MLTPILILDVALVAWSMHLMGRAFHHREFSLVLAGTLVALAAIAIVVVYFLMGSCVSHISEISQRSYF